MGSCSSKQKDMPISQQTIPPVQQTIPAKQVHSKPAQYNIDKTDSLRKTDETTTKITDNPIDKIITPLLI